MPGERQRLSFDRDAPIWELQAGEGTGVFARFVAFRDFGPAREIKHFAEAEYAAQPEPKERTYKQVLRRWHMHCYRGRWVERVREYDSYLDARRRTEREEAERAAVRTATARHAALTTGLVSLGGKALQTWFEAGALSKAKIESLTVGELLSILRTGIGLDRMVLGIGQDGTGAGDTPVSADAGPSFEDLKRVAREALGESSKQLSPDPVIVPPPRPASEAGPPPPNKTLTTR